MRFNAVGVGVLTGVVAVFCVRTAFAEGASCEPVAIEADVSVSTRWPGVVERAREAFEARDDIDRCARVRLTLGEQNVTLEVMLPDGRSAARAVSRREDIVPTLEALLLVPQRTAQVQPSVLEPPGRKSPAANGSRALPIPDCDTSAASPVHRSSHLRIELSVLTGARIGDGQTGVGLGALSFLDLSGWLVGFEGRADRYKPLSGGPTDGGALELAVLGGRRFRFDDIALDLTAGPAAAMQGTATFVTQSSITGNAVTKSSSSTVPRLLLSARVSFSALSTLHTFVGIDGEVGPSRAGGTDVPAAPQLPIWTLGLALGAIVGTQ